MSSPDPSLILPKTAHKDRQNPPQANRRLLTLCCSTKTNLRDGCFVHAPASPLRVAMWAMRRSINRTLGLSCHLHFLFDGRKSESRFERPPLRFAAWPGLGCLSLGNHGCNPLCFSALVRHSSSDDPSDDQRRSPERRRLVIIARPVEDPGNFAQPGQGSPPNNCS